MTTTDWKAHAQTLAELNRRLRLPEDEARALAETASLLHLLHAHPTQAKPLLDVLQKKREQSQRDLLARQEAIITRRVSGIVQHAVSQEAMSEAVSAKVVGAIAPLRDALSHLVGLHGPGLQASSPEHYERSLDAVERAGQALREACRGLGRPRETTATTPVWSLAQMAHELADMQDKWAPLPASEQTAYAPALRRSP